MSNLLSSYEVRDGKVYISTPYCGEVVKQCRAWAGKFSNGRWTVPVTRLSEIQKQLGVNLEDRVEVEVGKNNLTYTGAQYCIGWYVLAGRRSRDPAADVYADLVAGEIPSDGGSMKYPLVQASSDARFRLWVARDFAVAYNLQVITDPVGNQVVDPKQVLREEREKLLNRLAEIDKLLGE